ncbi:hypothetical protein MIMGU_mgv1a002389mg [Erythranthe guttata]|uniref:Pentacotripeptide-repeat region of PRORP domain-containing protein n=1 Tax=Erythranthe guttata TaxID=4155 RepID=A0A022QXU3_ERYGU|nr:hypothetical protein MIMGU_mgv1a002389mg [Erythranthe guttata]
MRRITLKPFKTPPAAAAANNLRRFSADVHPVPPSTPSPDLSSPISQTLSLLQTTDPSSWPTNSNLQTLLSSLSPPAVLRVTRQLPNYQNALHFFNHLKTAAELSDSIPLAFQAVLEVAMRENPGTLCELFVLSKEQNIPLSVNAATLLIKYFGRGKKLDEMMSVFDSMDEEMKNTDVLNLVIVGFLKWGRFNDALKLLDEMLEPDSCYPPNTNTAGIVFSSILKKNWSGRRVTDEEICNLVTSFSEHGSDVEIASCNALLTGLANNHDFARMNLLMKEMKESGIKPNIVTYGITINQLSKLRRLDEALEVLEQMRGGEVGVEPDVVIYNTLINGLCKVGRQDEAGEIDKGNELFEQMSKEGVEINVVTLNTLVDGMCKHGRVSSAMELFNNIREKGVKGNAVTYTVLITAFCNVNNIDRAMKLFDEMQENGCSSDAVVYYSLISGLCQAGRMDDATFVVSRMKEAGFCLDVVSYNILIGGFCRKNKLDKAAEMLKDMETAGVKPDRVTYNTLLSFFCSNGDFKHAHKVMKKMIGDGLTPNVVTYGAMIQAYCTSNNIDAAMKIYTDMSSSSKVPPNTVIYNMLIDSLCKNDGLEVALTLMDDMKEKGVRQNSNTYNALFKGLRQRKMLEKALEFMDQMTEQACNPDYVTMEILTEWLSEVGEIEKLRKFVQGYQVSASTI